MREDRLTPGQVTGPTIQRLQDELSAWIERQFANWQSVRLAGPKVIRDPIHQFIRLEPHEVGVLDTPIVQRLRHIHQTALTFLVYPGANHSRLEHSLGTLSSAQSMLEAIAWTQQLDERIRVHVRLAALLHDVGHVLFSHLGESVLAERFPEVARGLQDEPYHGQPRFFGEAAVGEALAYLIINSPPF